jgi:hypothetical protein
LFKEKKSENRPAQSPAQHRIVKTATTTKKTDNVRKRGRKYRKKSFQMRKRRKTKNTKNEEYGTFRWTNPGLLKYFMVVDQPDLPGPVVDPNVRHCPCPI